jgi:hypothetical protein
VNVNDYGVIVGGAYDAKTSKRLLCPDRGTLLPHRKFRIINGCDHVM